MEALSSLNNIPFVVKFLASYVIVILFDFLDLIFSGDFSNEIRVLLGLTLAILLSLNKYFGRIFTPKEIASGQSITQLTIVNEKILEGTSEIVIEADQILFIQEGKK